VQGVLVIVAVLSCGVEDAIVVISTVVRGEVWYGFVADLDDGLVEVL
jgi:hypothetical protein